MPPITVDKSVRYVKEAQDCRNWRPKVENFESPIVAGVINISWQELNENSTQSSHWNTDLVSDDLISGAAKVRNQRSNRLDLLTKISGPEPEVELDDNGLPAQHSCKHCEHIVIDAAKVRQESKQ